MTSKTLRRRLHHGDVDGKTHEHLEASSSDGLNEPLLGNYECSDRHSEVRPLFVIHTEDGISSVNHFLWPFAC